MNVLVLYNSNLFPITRANQQRIYQTILSISQYHKVDVVSFYQDEEQRREADNRLGCVSTLHLFPAAPASLRYKGIELGGKFLRKLTFAPKARRNARYYYRKDISAILTSKVYDAVISEYWHWADLFDCLPPSTTRIIDTHNVNFQKKALKVSHGNTISKRLHNRRLEQYRQSEMRAYEKADVLIAIATQDERFFRKTFPDKRIEYIPIGIYISTLEKYELSPKENTILFYGGMSDSQNKLAFWRLYDHILPKIRTRHKDVKLLVVGNNPPESILALNNDDDVRVTGYVEDTFPYLCQSKVCVLPMMTAGGFRGRILEVMGLGIPTVGTHNALDCINFTNGRDGFITDDDEEMADIVIRLLSDHTKWNTVSNSAKEFIKDTYSMEEIGKRYVELLPKE